MVFYVVLLLMLGSAVMAQTKGDVVVDMICL
jgi:hypothetical protein